MRHRETRSTNVYDTLFLVAPQKKIDLTSAARAMGKVGGSRKVKKGFARMDPEKVAAAGRKGGSAKRKNAE
jgi:hypothetical protein